MFSFDPLKGKSIGKIGKEWVTEMREALHEVIFLFTTQAS